MRALWLRYSWLRAFSLGVEFLTRVPLPSGFQSASATFSEDMRRALRFFPLIGALIGASTGVVLYLGALFCPFGIAVLLALAFEARLTGALHEDALADFCDAFGGGSTSADVLRILKDSRIGSYGLLGLGLAFALRAAGLIASGTPERAAFVLVAAGSLGRLTMLMAMVSVPPLPERDGLANSVASQASRRDALYAALLLTPLIALADASSLGSFVVSMILSGCFLAWYRAVVMRRLGGATGDCMGTAAYCGIVLTTLAFTVRA